jgi:YYY domain-containing protein
LEELDPLSGGAAEPPQPTSEPLSKLSAPRPGVFAAPVKAQPGKNGQRARLNGLKRGASAPAALGKLPAPDAAETAPPAIAQPSWQARLAGFRDALPDWLRRLNWPLILLLVLLAGALAVRLYGLDWDDNQHQHPDERAIIMVVMSFQWPHSLSELLSPHSPLSPHFSDGTPFFAYGTFPMYLLWLLASLLNGVQQTFGLHWIPAGQGSFTDYDHITLVGRALSALFDTGTVLVTYLLGRRLSGKKAVGLLAAAFVAFTPLEVQLAHFFTVDTALTFFIVLALYACVGFAQDGGLRWVLLAGVATGLALASKFSALPLLVPLLLAAVLFWQRSDWLMALPRLLMSLGAGLLTFLVTMPYALLDLPDFEAAIKQQGDLTTGLQDLPYVRQFAGTTPYLYELKNMLLYDLGVPLALLCFVGCIVVARKVWRSWRDEYLIALSWVLLYFAITGSFYTKYSRYMLPIFPLLCIFGAAALLALWQLGVARRAASGLAKITMPLPRISGPAPQARPARAPGRLRAWVSAGSARWLARSGRWLAAGLAVVVLGSSFLFTLAFDHMYSQPLTRIEASRWLYQHVPPGNGGSPKTITYEIWDDSLPLAIDGQGGCYVYNCVGLPLYDDDTPQKATFLAQTLAKADAVVISSQRLYPDSIPRLPERYPLSNRYYQLLFAGKLGFHLAAVFQNSPNLFGVSLDDSGADESYFVFDHPTVHIFLPDATRPSAAQLEQLLTQGLTLPPPIALTGAQNPLTLTPAQIAANQASPPLGQQFPADSFANQHPLLVWWLVLEVMGLLAFPLVAFVLRRFRDRGWAFAKTIALLLVGYLVWLPASLQLLPYTWATTLGALLVVGVAGFAVGWATRADLLAFARQRWRLLLGTEALFTLAFLGFAVIRAQNPDLFHIWRGGEKPMELAYIDGILRSRYFPPLDAWFSGGYINYYYYGQYLLTILIRLSSVIPTTAFNLADPTLFALVLTGAFSIVSHLTRRWWAGLLGGFFVAMMANLDGLHQVLAAWQHHTPLAFDYWASSRVIPNTINEFPFWSFLFADLHPHVIDLPVEILMIGLAVALISERPAKPASPTLAISRLLMLGLVLGAIYCINTWDLPTYAFLILLAILWREYNAVRPGWRLSYAVVQRAIGSLVVIGVCAYLFYQPFWAHFQTTAASGIGPVSKADQLADYVTLFGIWLFIAASFFFVELYQWAAGRLAARLAAGPSSPGLLSSYTRLFWALALAAAFAFAFIYIALAKLLPVLYALLVLGIVLFLIQGRRQRSSKQVTYLCLLMGIGLSILVETIYIRDFLDNSDWERMNTIFKFFMQVWLFYALGSALAVFEIVRWAWRAHIFAHYEANREAAAAKAAWAGEADELEDDYPELAGAGRRTRLPALSGGGLAGLGGLLLATGRGRFPGVVRWAWSAGLALLVLACSIFLVAGTEARIADHAVWVQAQTPVNSANYTPTLDGMAYMAAWYPGDYDAIQWMNDHIAGAPVILEASCGSYQWYSRVSIYTGLPTVVGWGDHEGEQRYGAEVGVRVSDVQTIYATTDPQQALDLIHKYDVQYIYLGQLERATCGDFGGQPGNPLPAAAISKFNAMVGTSLQIVYQNPDVTIYKVIG